MNILKAHGTPIILAALAIAAAGCASTPAKPFTPASAFNMTGVWDGTFTNYMGTAFHETMVLEEGKDGTVLGRYVAYEGREVPGGVRGRVNPPNVRLVLEGVEVTLTLVSENELAGRTRWNPTDGVVPGSFHFTRTTREARTSDAAPAGH